MCRGDEFLDELPLANSALRSIGKSDLLVIHIILFHTIIFCQLMDVFKILSIKLPLIFALGLNTFVEDFDGDTDGDEALLTSFRFCNCLTFEPFPDCCSFDDTADFVTLISQSWIRFSCSISSSSSGISDSIWVSNRSSFPRELEWEEFEDPTEQ